MKTDVTIVGGGITGLVSAYFLARQDLKVRVLEAQTECGGLLATFPIAGNRLEYFYHHFFTHDQEMMWLLKILELENDILFAPSTMGVYANEKIYPFNSPKDLLSFEPLNFKNKLQFAFSSLYLSHFAHWKKNEHVSALKWFERYSGKQTTENLWRPMMNVKFGDSAPDVPLSWMIGRLSQRVKSRQGSVEKLGYVRGSLFTLLQKLLEKLKNLNVEILTSHPLEEIAFKGNAISGLKSKNQMFESDHYLFTLPSPYLSPFFKSFDPSYASFLSQTQCFGASCFVLELDAPLSDTYWLNVTDPRFTFGGVIEHTNLIPKEHYQNRHIVYLSKYFLLSDPFANKTNEEITALYLKELAVMFPHFSKIKIHSTHVFRTSCGALVTDLHFSKKVPSMKMPFQNGFIANMNHIYPDERSCNNSIRVAANVTQKMGVSTSDVPHGKSLAGLIGI